MKITESAPLLGGSGSRWRARLIEAPVLGSSGYYPLETVRRDGPGAFPASTPIYFDHPSESEDRDRPERSVRDLAGKITSTPVMEADGLYADVEFYSWAADVVREMGPDIGLSIRATAEATAGEVNGKPATIITRLIEGASVDLVTKAGAGGRLVSLLESARPITETSSSERSEQIRHAIGAAYPGDDYAWIRDYDPDRLLVWYEADDIVWQQGYTVADDGRSVTLAGSRVEVRPTTTYLPVAATGPVGESAPRNTTKEKSMEITEAQYAELTTQANRVAVLEAELAAEKQRAEAAEADARKAARKSYDTQVTAALAASGLPQETRARAADRLVLDESADVPTDVDARIAEAIKVEADYLAAVAPQVASAKRPLGFGGSRADATPAVESYTNPWGRTITTKEA